MDAVSKYKPKKDNEIKLKYYLNKDSNGNRLGKDNKCDRFRQNIQK
jgi:hypothetical protein